VPLLAGLMLCGASAALAQYDDEQTRDHEEQDRIYQERYAKPPNEREPAPAEEEGEGLRAATIAEADRLIRDRHHRATDSEHYRVQSDDPRLVTDEAAALLEEFRACFERYFGARLELAPYDERSQVYLFYSFYKFNELLAGDHRYRTARPKGHYDVRIDVITLHSDADTPGGLANALVHEAAHQLVERRIYAHGPGPSLWVSEGLAAYFGFTYRDERGGFRPGSVGGKSVRLLRDVKDGGNEARLNLQNARDTIKAARKTGASATRGVISITDPRRFYDSAAATHYAVAWAVVHTLLHGQDGALANRFIAYLRLEARGAGGAEVLYRELGMDADELESAVTAHLENLKAR
jgi:hypothetical protein